MPRNQETKETKASKQIQFLYSNSRPKQRHRRGRIGPLQLTVVPTKRQKKPMPENSLPSDKFIHFEKLPNRLQAKALSFFSPATLAEMIVSSQFTQRAKDSSKEYAAITAGQQLLNAKQKQLEEKDSEWPSFLVGEHLKNTDFLFMLGTKLLTLDAFFDRNASYEHIAIFLSCYGLNAVRCGYLTLDNFLKMTLEQRQSLDLLLSDDCFYCLTEGLITIKSFCDLDSRGREKFCRYFSRHGWGKKMLDEKLITKADYLSVPDNERSVFRYLFNQEVYTAMKNGAFTMQDFIRAEKKNRPEFYTFAQIYKNPYGKKLIDKKFLTISDYLKTGVLYRNVSIELLYNDYALEMLSAKRFTLNQFFSLDFSGRQSFAKLFTKEGVAAVARNSRIVEEFFAKPIAMDEKPDAASSPEDTPRASFSPVM